MIRKEHETHTTTNPWHHEEESKNDNSNMAFRIKQSALSSQRNFVDDPSLALCICILETPYRALW